MDDRTALYGKTVVLQRCLDLHIRLSRGKEKCFLVQIPTTVISSSFFSGNEKCDAKK